MHGVVVPNHRFQGKLLHMHLPHIAQLRVRLPEHLPEHPPLLHGAFSLSRDPPSPRACSRARCGSDPEAAAADM
jgi:hypothetical protein